LLTVDLYVAAAINGASPLIVARSHASMGLVRQVVFHLLPDFLKQLYVLGAIDAHLIHGLDVLLKDNLLPQAKLGLYLAA
jgi:predicted RecB family endonuclease